MFSRSNGIPCCVKTGAAALEMDADEGRGESPERQAGFAIDATLV
jgi:hypothetical protein